MEPRDLRLLLIDSDVTEAARLQSELQSSTYPIQIETVSSLREGLVCLSKQTFDAILLDISASGPTASETFRQLRAKSFRIPIIVLAAASSQEAAVQTLASGAHDYLLKETLQPQQMIEKIRWAIERERIYGDWKAAVDQAFLQATRDPLTGLPNRFLLEDRMAVALSEARRNREMLGVLFIDLDGFKEVNEQQGHAVGDEVLTLVGFRLSLALRLEDTLARVGGDEFVALIRRAQDPADIGKISQRFLDSLKVPLQLKEISLTVSASIGISRFPADGETMTTLLKAADHAMFQAKNQGRGCMKFFSTPKPVAEKVAAPSSRKILIVEDDEDTLNLLDRRLHKEGYQCTKCKNVESALSSLDSLHPDLVILDLGFRTASGIAFLQNLTRHASEDHGIPPVVVVSGHNDPEIIDYATRLGARAFIAKPFNASDVLSAVRSLIH